VGAVRVAVPTEGIHRDGKLTDEQCYAVKKGTAHREIIDTYGYPPGDQWDDPFALFYPVRGSKGARTCTISFDFDKVSTRSLDLP
jgi:hypothetical protein